MLPVLDHTAPEAAADALRWRLSTLDLAKERAGTLGLAGAAFPWRTIRGQECSGYWPAGTAAFHINADIAVAVERYRVVTGDQRCEAECGAGDAGRDGPAVDVARATTTGTAQWHIDGVTGPDEYTAIVRRQHLHEPDGGARTCAAAADAVSRHPRWPSGWRSTGDEMATWRDAAEGGAHPVRRGARRARAMRRLHRPAGVGLRAQHAARTRCC